MTTVLPPGIHAPDFTLSAGNYPSQVSLQDHLGRNLVLFFFPADHLDTLATPLADYQARFENQDVALIGLSNATPEILGALAQAQGLTFPLLSDPGGATAARYGAAGPEGGGIQPAVYITDETGLIRRVYEPGKYADLPNPAMVARALKKFADQPRPTPVTLDDWQKGPADAPVVVIEYADYQCTPCRQAYRMLRSILPDYGDRVLWTHRHLPLRHSHPLAQGAAEAAEAAGLQGQFWAMHDRLFEAEGDLEPDRLLAYARELGLDVERFRQDLDSGRCRDAVNQDFKIAVRNKIKLPPALFINGIPLEGPRTESAIRERIETLLAWLTKLKPE
jgi:peroxiredoxin